MHISNTANRPPSKEERRIATQSYAALTGALEQIRTSHPEIEIEETGEHIELPLNALKLLADILKGMSEGRIVSVVPTAAEMTTQAAADMLGCSRPHLVKLLEGGVIPFHKVGKHRRVRFEDVMAYQAELKAEREKLLVNIMQADEADGLYDL